MLQKDLFTRPAHPVYSKQGFLDYKFHPSSLKYLMTGGSGKTALKTCGAIIAKELDGVETGVCSLAMEKGNMRENDSIELYNQVTGLNLTKNKKTFIDDYFEGTPDLFTTDKVIDIKTAKNYAVFTEKTESDLLSEYKYQLIAYMKLLGLEKAEIAYCCPDSTKNIISSELRALFYSLEIGDLTHGVRDLMEEVCLDILQSKTPGFQEMAQERIFEFHKTIGIETKSQKQQEAYFVGLKQIIHSNIVNDLPAASRVKIVSFELDETKLEKMYTKLDKHRLYLHNRFLQRKQLILDSSTNLV